MTEPVSESLCSAWATEADLPDDRPELPEPTTWDELLVVASEILWALSGRQWSGNGGCEASASMLLDRERCVGWLLPGDSFTPVAVSLAQKSMQLPHDEATEVVSVTVGGSAFTDYELRGGWLTRTDGRGWNEADVSITYKWGHAPPLGGKRAAIAYALELGKALTNDSTCRLPKRVQTVTRQGVSMTLIDPQTYLEKGKLGIPDIDQWLASVNPRGHAERGSVWSPDVPRARPT